MILPILRKYLLSFSDHNNQSLLSIEKACHKILVTSNSNRKETVDKEKNIDIVDYDHVQEAITRCLEEPVRDLLHKWDLVLNNKDKTEEAQLIRTDIENIRKQLLCEENTADNEPSSSNGTENIIPDDITTFLLSSRKVNSFGIWDTSTFKVFVTKETNNKLFHDEIRKINAGFFKEYTLEVATGEFRVKKITLMQGSTIRTCSKNEKIDEYKQGTLGGFVTKKDDSDAKYALTCEHVIPFEDGLAFSSDKPMKLIGDCVFKSKRSDFAAIKIKDSISDDCDTIFRRDDHKETNARVYEDDIKKIGTVHKIGGASNLTTGFIKSPEFYYSSPDDNGRKHRVFLVRGRDDVFSLEGDSGSLVFSRPRRVMHSYVNVVGMVSGRAQDDEKISCCYPITPALQTFANSLESSVQFKDNLPPSSSSLSSSSSSLSSPSSSSSSSSSLLSSSSSSSPPPSSSSLSSSSSLY